MEVVHGRSAFRRREANTASGLSNDEVPCLVHRASDEGYGLVEIGAKPLDDGANDRRDAVVIL